LGWLAWGALVPWLLSIGQASPRQAFLRSYLLGLGFFGGTIWWLGHVTVPGMILLAAYLSLFFGAWGWFANRSRNVLLTLPVAWVILEYLRGTLLTGFGWNLLAHTQWNWIPVIQIADLTGVYGVSFLIVLVNAALFLALKRRGKSPAPSLLGVALVCLTAAVGYGQFRLQQMDHPPRLNSFPITRSEPFKVAVVQGNIPQPKKWDDAFAEAIWKRYVQLTEEAAQERPALIIWPETAVPGYLQESEVLERLQSIARRVQTPLLVGAPTEGEDGKLFNTAVLIDHQGKVLEQHDKLHLVPFGEYIPLKFLFGWLRQVVVLGDFSPGQRFTVFRSSEKIQPFSVLVCFEDLFPGLCRTFIQRGATWIVVITNDGWFKRSAASLQHLQASVCRAVEIRVWVVRAANTVWSGFVDPTGRRLEKPQQVPRFQPGIAVAEFQGIGDGTFYSHWGDWFVGLCGGIIIFFGRRKNGNSGSTY